MSEAHVIAIAVSLSISFVAVLVGVLLNYKRLDDFKDVLKAQIETRAPAKELYELRVFIEKNHSETLLRFADIDNRLSRIENERRVLR